MLKKIFLCLVVIFSFIFLNGISEAKPNWKMPVEPGYFYQVMTQYGGLTYLGSTNIWHTDFKNAYYAIDFDNPKDYPNPKIVATESGIISKIGCDPNGYGNYVYIDHGAGYESRYAHLDSIESGIDKGVYVSQGQVLGVMGSTGNSSGSHLHFVILYNGECLKETIEAKPEPLSKYTDIKVKQMLYSDNYYNRFSFTFDNGSPQGFTCGFDTKEIKGEIPAEGFKDNFFVDITGPNSGIKSSSFSCGINPNDFVIIAKAGLLTSDRGNSAEVYLKDQAEDWAYPVAMKKIEALSPDEQAKVEMYVRRDESNTDQFLYQDPITGTIWIFGEEDYQIFVADLSTAVRKPFEIKQFSLELVNKNEGRLLLDDVVVCSKRTSWDFGDVEKGQMGWTILKDATHADFFPAGAGYWRMNVTGGYSAIESPWLYGLSADFDTVKIEYSIRPKVLQTGPPPVFKTIPNTQAVLMCDIGNGYESTVSWRWADRDNSNQNISFDIPAEFIGKIKRVKIALMSDASYAGGDSDYKDQQIAIDKILFLQPGGSGGGIIDDDRSPILTRISITGPTSLSENSGAQYTCIAHYDDGSSINITNSAGWEEGCGNASIDPRGYLTTYSVSSDESCEVGVAYGETMTAAYPIVIYDESGSGGDDGSGDTQPDPPAPSGPYTFLRSTFCGAIQNSDSLSPVGEQEVFHENDTIVLWFGLEDVTIPITPKAEFFLPDGSLYCTQSWSEMDNPDQSDWVFQYSMMTVDANGGCERVEWQGDWTVKVYINDELVDTNHFTVQYNGEVASTVYYKDRDGDGYSDGETKLFCPDRMSEGYKLSYKLPEDLFATSGDCDDSNPNIHPGVSEICDGIDNNCDGYVDENTPPAKPTGLRITNISPR